MKQRLTALILLCALLTGCAAAGKGEQPLTATVLAMDTVMNFTLYGGGMGEEQLRQAGEISTPIDTLSWKYFQYVLSHPVGRWSPPTSILYATRDALQSREVIDDFCAGHDCRLTVAENSDHPFMEPGDEEIVAAWIRNSIQ